jgi:hypothetical protein
MQQKQLHMSVMIPDCAYTLKKFKRSIFDCGVNVGNSGKIKKMPTQEESDHQFALLLARESYFEDEDYYGVYADFIPKSPKNKKTKRKSEPRDEEWNPDGKKPKKAIKKQSIILEF